MKKHFLVIGGIVGAVAAAAVATPAVAAAADEGNSYGNNHVKQMMNRNGVTMNDSGNGPGAETQGTRNHMGGNSNGMRKNGYGLNIDALEKGTLTDTQKTTLASMAEEEKLAHDVYVTLAEKYPDVTQFTRVSRSETRHLEAVRALLAKYSIPDPTAGLKEDEFATARFTNLYTQLVGSATTPEEALQAGVAVEKTDIADLQKAQEGLSAPDVSAVYEKLETASSHHLKAFGG